MTYRSGGGRRCWRSGAATRRRTTFLLDFLWHSHHNADPHATAKVVRVHMFDSLLDTMRVLMDPVTLFEEPPDEVRDRQAGDPSTVDWLPLTRPAWRFTT